MKIIVIIGDHPRNLILLSCLIQIPDIEVIAVIKYSRSELIPPPPDYLTTDEKRLWKLHFNKRATAEERTFNQLDINGNYAEISVSSPSELNSKHTEKFIAQFPADCCFLTGVPILTENIMNMLPPYTVNLHLGLIPEYKGTITMFWPFYFLEPGMAGCTFHIIDKYVDTGEIIHQTVPELHQGMGIHDVACAASIAALKDLPVVIQHLVSRIPTQPIKKDKTLHFRGKLFKNSDWKPAMLRVIYDCFEDKIVDLYLSGQLKSRQPDLIKIK